MTLPWHKRRTENILRETIEAVHLQKVIIPLKRKSQYLLTRKNEGKHHGSEFSWFVAVQLIQSVHPDSAYQRKTTLYHPINVSSWQSRTSFFDLMNRKESFHLEGLLLAAQILHFHIEMWKLRRNWTSWGRGQKISEVLTTHCKYWLQIQNSSSKLNEFLFSLPIDLVKLRGQTDKTLYSWRPNSNN